MMIRQPHLRQLHLRQPHLRQPHLRLSVVVLVVVVLALATAGLAAAGIAATATAPQARKRDLPFFCLSKTDDFFVCAQGTHCVNKKAVCDGHDDCPDRADEVNCACVRRKDCPKGQKCRKNLDLATSECTLCPDGKRFVNDQCEDIDECLELADPCAGRGSSCVNYDGGYTCVQCPLGYEARMHDWRYFVAANRTLADGAGGSGINGSGSNANSSNNNNNNNSNSSSGQTSLDGEQLQQGQQQQQQQQQQFERRDALRRLFLCDDEDECTHDNACRGGICVNRVGNFSCECPPNHAPYDSNYYGRYNEGGHGDAGPTAAMSMSGGGAGDDNVCRAIGGQPLIAIAENMSIDVYELRSTERTSTISIDQPLVDVAAYSRVVFYAFARQIWEYRIDTAYRALIVDLDEDADFLVSEIRKLAVDWLSRRIYYLTGDAIAITDFFGRSGKLVEHRGTISTIAVDPVARYLFYSEQGLLKRAHLDGRPTGSPVIFRALDAPDVNDHGHGGHQLQQPQQQQQQHPHAHGIQPNGGGEALTLDPNLRSLYYIFDRVLYSFDYEGHHAVVLNTAAPYSRLESFEERLYAVYRSNSSGLVSLPRIGYTIGPRQGRASVVKFYETRPRALAILHPAKYPAGSDGGAVCRQDACGASGWCFPLPAGLKPDHRCLCGQVDGFSSRTSPSAAEAQNCVPLRLRTLRQNEDGGALQDVDNDLNNLVSSSAEINAAAAAAARGAVVPRHSYVSFTIIPSLAFICLLGARAMLP